MPALKSETMYVTDLLHILFYESPVVAAGDALSEVQVVNQPALEHSPSR